MTDGSRVKAALDSWAKQRGFGTVADWDLSFDGSGAGLRLRMTGGELRIAWTLSRDCEPTGVVASSLTGFTAPPPTERLAELARKVVAQCDIERIGPASHPLDWKLVAAAIAALAFLAAGRALMPRRRSLRLRSIAAALILSLGSFCISLLAGECLVRLFGIEDRLVINSLFWVPGGTFAEDPFLHYRPFAPRFRAIPPEKTPDTVRVLCFGGSTMWGTSVAEDETIAARLEARLSAASSGRRRFEVGNFGVPGYTLGQAARLAREELTALSPDLIVVQIHNRGRRPFSGMPDAVTSIPRERPGVDVDFFLEQFPVPTWLSPEAHRFGLAHSSLYRSCIAASTHFFSVTPSECARCNELSQGEARTLTAEAGARGVSVLFVAIPNGGPHRPEEAFPGLSPDRFLDTYRPGREDGFYLVHPSASVLDEIAGMIADAVRSRQLLPGEHDLARLP